MHIIGSLALVVTISISLYTAYSFYVGNAARGSGEKQQKAGRDGIFWQFASTTFASLILLLALVNNDFSFDYVASHSTTQMSIFYKIAAFWAGHEGSLLLWLWMLTGLTAVLAFLNRNSDRLTNLALYVSNYVQLFLLVTILFASNPFQAAAAGMNFGSGINPLLMHWAMVLHPPTLFMGYAGFTIPFAFAIAALMDRNASSDWIERAHKWTLFAWLFLSIGLILGALWAYVVLGWGGYWAWDPVENATLLPWFAGTALLHTFTIYRRRGGMKVWAVALATLSLVMCVMATFITRSGLIQSVHAFPELRWDLTFLFGGFMLTAAAVTAYLVNTRREEFETQEFFSDFLSKHFTYYLNNIALVTFTFIVAGATVIPPFFGQALGQDFYNQLAKPLGILYLLLITICPFLGWTKTEGGKLLKQLTVPAVVAAVAAVPIYMEWGSNLIGFITMVVAVFSATATLELFYLGARSRAEKRGMSFISSLLAIFKFNRSQAGGYIGHLGMAIMIFGIAGSMLYVQEIPVTVKSQQGQVVQAGHYEFELKDFKKTTRLGQQVDNVIFEMRDLSKGNKPIRDIAPKLVYHEVQRQRTMEAAVHYEPLRDVFVVINGVSADGIISLNVKINPLISFVWVGSFILIIGTIIAMWPKAAPSASERATLTELGKKTGRREEVPAGVE